MQDVEAKFIEAVRTGTLNEVKGFFNKDVHLNAYDNLGWSALMHASRARRFDVVKILVDNQAEVNHRALDGKTVLIYAAIGGKVDIVDLLIKKGVNLDEKDNDGWSALMWSAAKGNAHLSIVELLLSNGANMEIKDNNGRTALDLAQINMQGDIIGSLDPVIRQRRIIEGVGHALKRLQREDVARNRVR